MFLKHLRQTLKWPNTYNDELKKEKFFRGSLVGRDDKAYKRLAGSASFLRNNQSGYKKVEILNLRSFQYCYFYKRDMQTSFAATFIAVRATDGEEDETEA